MRRREFLTTGVTGLAAGPALWLLGAKVSAGEDAALRPSPDPARLAEATIAHFLPEGRTCCESILMAGCQALGIESELVPDIALGLAGGIGLQGRTCGAVTGAALVLGIALGPLEPEHPKRLLRVCEAVQALSKEFEERFGTLECRKLCGLDLTTPEGRKTLKERVKAQTCRQYMEACARMLAQRLGAA